MNSNVIMNEMFFYINSFINFLESNKIFFHLVEFAFESSEKPIKRIEYNEKIDFIKNRSILNSTIKKHSSFL